MSKKKNIVEKVEEIKLEKMEVQNAEKTEKSKEVKDEKVEGKKEKKSISKKKVISIVALIIFIVCVFILIANFIIKSQNKNDIKEVQNFMPTTETVTKDIETMKKVAELQKENNDIRGWIKIVDTVVNYPLLQGKDNEYYLKHDYKKEYSKYGSIYLKSGVDINDKNSNLIVYGHNMKDDEMFNCLLNYVDEEFYKTHKTINITTENEEREYEIISVFKSRVFYQEEKDVFRYYNYLNFKNEEEFNEYIKNVKAIELYDTGIEAKYGEQLLTLITCEYSQENGRMIVVAKRVK